MCTAIAAAVRSAAAVSVNGYGAANVPNKIDEGEGE